MVHLVRQDLSVAGKRAGLKHSEMGDDETTRSGLFMEQIRIIKEQRNESIKRLSSGGATFDIRCVQPRYTVWENVCGAFSSNNGEDFRAVLEETCKVADENAYVPRLAKGQKWASAGCIMGDGYSVAWRVHDAQFWGVPQRRKRICVLADYGGHTAPEILFELLGETNDSESYKIVTDIREQSRPKIQVVGKSLSGNTEQGGEKGKGITETVTDSVGETSSYTLKIRGGVDVDSHGKRAGKGALVQTELSGTLGVSQDQTLITGECLNPWDVQSKHIQSENGVAESLYSGECRYGGGESYVMQSNVGCDLYNQTITGETAATLNAASGGSPTHSGPSVIGVDLYNQTTTGNVSKTLNAIKSDSDHVPCVCFEPGSASRLGGHVYEDDVSGSLRANAGDNAQAVAYSTQACGDRDNASQSVQEEIAYTIPSNPMSDRGQAVCYGISAYDSNAMKSPNPHSGVYEADTSRTLDLNGGSPACNQGGMAVVQAFDGLNNATSEEVSPTLMCQRQDVKNIPSVAYGLDRASFNQGQNAKFGFSVIEEQSPTITAKGPGGGGYL